MREFKRVTVLALLVWLGAIAFTQASLYLPFRLWLSGDQRWMHALDGHSGCRVYLVGSSAVLYGLSAEQLEQKSGCRATNTALPGIGTDVTSYLLLVLQQTRPGDIVLLSDRDWLAQDGVESRCHFDDLGIPWLRLPRLVPNLMSLFGGRLARDRTAFGDLAVLPPLAGRQLRLAAKDVKTATNCRLNVLKHQLKLMLQKGVTPVLAAPPMLAESGDLLALRAEVQNLSVSLQLAVAPHTWVPPIVDSDQRYFSLEGQHTSALGRQQWGEAVAQALLAAVTIDARN